jgi:NAD-dependent DNA ligase
MNSNIDQDGQATNKSFNAKRRTERDIAEMLGLIKGILADGIINDTEVNYITNWLATHPDSISAWPGNILANRLERIFQDGKITEEERLDLKELLTDLVGGNAGIIGTANASTSLPLDNPAPNIVFKNNIFVLTGKFAFGPRKACEQFIQNAGGVCDNDITKRTRYVVIGTFSSTDWIQTSHGRKIEKAVELRETGQQISIIGEDHWAASLPQR